MGSEKDETIRSNGSSEQENLTTSERRRQLFKSFEAKSLRSRSILTQIADDLTAIFGSQTFLFLNILFFVQWIAFNLGWVPGFEPWDPYPFGLLTMIVSLEAIILSIVILVSQNRSSYVSSLREEVHLRVNLIAEEEITKILEVLAEMRKEMGIKSKDPELDAMLKRIDTNYIERSIQDQIERAKGKDINITKPLEVVKNIATTEINPSKKS